MRKTSPSSLSLGAPAHVVITGASGGLGRALAEHYARPGCLLSLTGRDPERLAATAKACRLLGAEVATETLDVTDADAMASWLAARDAAGDIDLVIANAGMGGSQVMPTPSGEGGDLARAIVSVNTLGVINAITPILPRMVARGRGHVAIVGSLAGAIGLPQSPVYSASKAAVHIYGDGLRRLVARHGVQVTVVLPGFVDTPMSQSLAMKRPFLWSAEKAARRIAHDVERGAARSIFPLPLRLAVGLQNYLPTPLVDRILARLAG